MGQYITTGSWGVGYFVAVCPIAFSSPKFVGYLPLNWFAVGRTAPLTGLTPHQDHPTLETFLYPAHKMKDYAHGLFYFAILQGSAALGTIGYRGRYIYSPVRLGTRHFGKSLETNLSNDEMSRAQACTLLCSVVFRVAGITTDNITSPISISGPSPESHDIYLTNGAEIVHAIKDKYPNTCNQGSPVSAKLSTPAM